MIKSYKGLIVIITLFSMIFISCSASTSDRYGTDESKKENKEENKKEVSNKEFKEDFDLTPYHATIDVNTEKKENAPVKNLDVWYNYETNSLPDTSAPEIVAKVDGFRVQVFSTDNLEEADSVRAQLYSQTNQKAVYLTFEPPFYKIKVGDFVKISEAKDLSFKLNQIGYTETRVINDKINVFSK